MSLLEQATDYLNRILAFLAGAALVSMILLTCGNIFLRIVWRPIPGAFELLGFFGAIAAAFALGYTQKFKMHIAVTILVDNFSSKTRAALNVINGFMCMSFFGLAAWQIAKWSGTLAEEGEVTETLQIIFYPFTYATALGCLVLALIFLVEILRVFFPAGEEAK